MTPTALNIPTVRVAHSPDADDAFMFYGLATEQVRTPGYQFEHILCDIQRLNEAAKDGKYELTAISYAAYPFLQETYQIVSVGSSVGNQYGPMVLTRKPMSHAELLRQVVAVPGNLTTATLALRLWEPSIQTIVMPFDEIVPAIQCGEVEAGLIIHEGQVTYPSTGLALHVDLGAWWFETTGLPLPLGGNAIRRDLPLSARLEISQLLKTSIAYSLANRQAALTYAMQFARDLSFAEADRFVGMYVNDMTLNLSLPIRQGIQCLFDKGYEQGFYSERVIVDFLDV